MIELLRVCRFWFGASCVLLMVAPATRAAERQGAVARVLHEYRAAALSGSLHEDARVASARPGGLEAHYVMWVGRFDDAIDSDAGSPLLRDALAVKVGYLNGLGRFRASAELSFELAETATDDFDEAHWLGHGVECAVRAARVHDPWIGQESLAAKLDRAAFLVAGADRSDRRFGQVASMVVEAAGTLAGSGPGQLGYGEIGEVLVHAADICTLLSEPVRARLEMLRLGREDLLSQAMVAFGRAGNIRRADALLAELTDPHRPEATAWHALSLAVAIRGVDEHASRQRLRSILEEHRGNPVTVEARLELIRSLPRECQERIEQLEQGYDDALKFGEPAATVEFLALERSEVARIAGDSRGAERWLRRAGDAEKR